MAKNTSSSAFRKIDVDQYNEDNFREDDADQASGMIVPDEAEITTLLNQYPFQNITLAGLLPFCLSPLKRG